MYHKYNHKLHSLTRQTLGDGACLAAGIIDTLLAGCIPVVFQQVQRDRLVYFTAEEFANMTIYIPEWKILGPDFKARERALQGETSVYGISESQCLMT